MHNYSIWDYYKVSTAGQGLNFKQLKLWFKLLLPTSFQNHFINKYICLLYHNCNYHIFLFNIWMIAQFIKIFKISETVLCASFCTLYVVSSPSNYS